MAYTTILKEEATTAANQYFDLFARQVKEGNVDFRFHLKEDLQYSMHCVEIISDHFRQFSQLLNFNPMEYNINRDITKKVNERVKKDFFPYLKEEYIPRLKEEIKNKQEDLADAEVDLKDWIESRPDVSEEDYLKIHSNYTSLIAEHTKQLKHLQEAFILLGRQEWS